MTESRENIDPHWSQACTCFLSKEDVPIFCKTCGWNHGRHYYNRKVINFNLPNDSIVIVSDHLNSTKDIEDSFDEEKERIASHKPHIWGSFHLLNFSRGNYKIEIEQKDVEGWGKRNTSVKMFNPEIDYKLLNQEKIAYFGVDAGTCMIIKEEMIGEYDSELDEWLDLDSICNSTTDIFPKNGEPFAVYMCTGFGDGIYTINGYYDANKMLVGMSIDFMIYDN